MDTDRWATAMAAALQARWREEIERAIDKVKRTGKRTLTDEWFRRLWRRVEWQMRNVKGPGLPGIEVIGVSLESRRPAKGPGGGKMEHETNLKNEQAKEELAEILVELIRTNGKVISAIYDCVCRCPNVVVEY